VVSAVDNQATRNYLGQKAAQFQIPLVEGGFSGSRVNSTILLNHSQEGPCWHCNLYHATDRNRDIQLGCTQAALRAEKEGYVPAIQTAAAFLGAFMSEAVIQLRHGNVQLGDAQIFMNVRTGKSSAARLKRSRACRQHPVPRETAFRLHVTPDLSCRQFLDELKRHVADPVVSLPCSYLVRVVCAECKSPISVNQPDWVLKDLLFCRDCGGSWDRIEESGIEVYPTLTGDDEPLLDLPVSHVGLIPGSFVEIESGGRTLRCELQSETRLPFLTPIP
jgi:hypothetical protein